MVEVINPYIIQQHQQHRYNEHGDQPLDFHHNIKVGVPLYKQAKLC